MSTDISIKDLKSAMIRADAKPQERANDRKKAQKFLEDSGLKIVEKIDGTKLTLLRRNNAFDPNDYTKNWYIAYKGNIIFPGEARKLASREEDVRAASSGTAQYSLVHKHLARVHPRTSSIPPNTEFFIEFVQKKPTISREYPQLHDMFLTFYGTSRYKATGTHLVTDITPENDQPRIEEYARVLELKTYPVLFEGSLSSLSNFKDGIRSNMIQRRFDALSDKLKDAYEDKTPDRPLKIIEVVYEIFSKFQTSLSTDADVTPEGEFSPAEGSVFTSPVAKKLYKALHPTGHDEEHREKIKQKYREDDPKKEQDYWNGIVGIAKEIATEFAPSQRRNISEAELDEILEAIHVECYFDAAIANRLGALVHSKKKALIQRQEDLFLTTKTNLMKRLEIGTRNGISIGIFVVSGKPVHEGHWQMIKKAAKCDEALIITSTAGRDELPSGVMIDAWKAVLEPQFHRDYPNATLIITSESPLQLAIEKMRQLKDVVNKFLFFSDDEDAKDKYAKEKIVMMLRDPVAASKLEPIPVPRSETVQISGTKMREFLANDDQVSFNKFVPQTLSPEMKNKYWSILKGDKVSIQDGKRFLLKTLLESIVGTKKILKR